MEGNDTTYAEERAFSGDVEKWRGDVDYWKRKHPKAFLNWEQNQHLPSRTLRVPWNADTMGLPPLVNVEFIPRKKPLPEVGFLAENSWLATFGSLALSTIPVVGGVLAAVAQVGATAHSLYEQREWAKKMKEFPPTAFAPQYFPEPFTVPMPLDRAQMVVDEPWFAPAMVDQFVKEWGAGHFRSAGEAYRLVNPSGVNFRGAVPVQSGADRGAVASTVPRGTSSLVWLGAGAAVLLLIASRR